MQPNRNSKPTLADNAALSGGAGLGVTIVSFLVIVLGVNDGSLSFLLLFGVGALLGPVAVVMGFVALARHSNPKHKAIIAIVTGFLNLVIFSFIIVIAIGFAMAFSSANV